MKKICKMLSVFMGLAVIFALIHKAEEVSNLKSSPGVVINEICSNNFSTAPLRGRENADWIELYNASGENINLEGWMLSDDTDNLDKYVFPDITMKAGELLLLYATGENIVTEDGIFLNFKLSDNEILSLVNSEGEVVDNVTIPDIRQNTSYARRMDASQEWCHVIPSPQSTNNDAEMIQTVRVEAPIFSAPGGVYLSGETVLELSVNDADLNIYYTLDGSVPSEESYCYTEPILISNRSAEANVLSARGDISTEYSYRYVPEVLVDKIMVVRAVAIDEEGNRSDVITNSYVVDIQEQSTYQDMAIVSISIEPEEFFDYADGLYVLGNEYVAYMEMGEDAEIEEPRPNYKLSGRTTEREANIEVYGANRELLLNQNVGIRVRGNATRRLSQKSFSIFAREMYDGNNFFNEDVFGNGEEYRKLRLLTDADETKIRHELHAQLLRDTEVVTQDYIRCNVFLNGEYWGVYSLVQAYDEQYLHNRYNIPEEEIVFNENLMPVELRELVENADGLTDEELYEELIERIDLESYIDYYASMIYIEHFDWLDYNGYMWRSANVSPDNPYQDGKWRWMLYDTETCEKHYDANTFREGLVSNWHDDPIAQVLMKNEEFREQFVVGFMDLANTVFEKENVYEKMDTVFATYSQAVEAQGIRWGDDWADGVYEELDDIREFYDKRFDYITSYLKEEFSLEGELLSVQVEVSDEEKGIIQINRVVPELKNNQWTGLYYSDYPIKISAREKEGYTFKGWYDGSDNLISQNADVAVLLTEDQYYYAEFE